MKSFSSISKQKCLLITGILLIIFFVISSVTTLFFFLNDDQQHTTSTSVLLSSSSFASTTKHPSKPPSRKKFFNLTRHLEKYFSSHHRGQVEKTKCTVKSSSQEKDSTRDRNICIDSKGKRCNCEYINADETNCCPADQEIAFSDKNEKIFAFSSYSECVATCLLPKHDERRIDTFIKLQHTRRYKNTAIKIIRRILSSKKALHGHHDHHDSPPEEEETPQNIFLSRTDVRLLFVANEGNNNNNHFGLWFCGEVCRFQGDDEESILFETRFKEGGPVFRF